MLTHKWAADIKDLENLITIGKVFGLIFYTYIPKGPAQLSLSLNYREVVLPFGLETTPQVG